MNTNTNTGSSSSSITFGSRKKTKIRVQFDDEMIVVNCTVSRSDNMTPEEKRNKWIQRDEYEYMLNEQLWELLVLEAWGELELYGNNRGAESIGNIMELESLNKAACQCIACVAVFEEQLMQRKGGYKDDNAIAAVYNRISSNCQYRAERIALKDYYEARR